MTGIEDITKEQWAQIEKIKEDWHRKQTVASSLEEVEDAVKRVYARLSLGEPKVTYLDSPFQCVLEAAARYVLSERRKAADKPKAKPKAKAKAKTKCGPRDPWIREAALGRYRNAGASEQEIKEANDDREFWSEMEAATDAFRYSGINVWAWLVAHAGFFEAVKVLGVEYTGKDLADYEDFTKWMRHVHASLPWDDECLVSRPPIKLSWQNGEMHCEDGPAIEYADGWKIWLLSGLIVDEQIVMRPETQTVEQLLTEDNAEIRRVRIERYGWDRFLVEVNAKEVNRAPNAVEGTIESLMQIPANGSMEEMRVLVCACPSTARVYTMEVPTDISKCEEAQKWLRNSNEGFCIGAS